MAVMAFPLRSLFLKNIPDTAAASPIILTAGPELLVYRSSVAASARPTPRSLRPLSWIVPLTAMQPGGRANSAPAGAASMAALMLAS
ncbi:hypothetical protein ASG32_02705 [Methylobacterium sp. Leaf361]|nr:hypothetical protein ASG32_02705 [Methylobacterium sp. Leaf361]